MIYPASCEKCGEIEIEKSMLAPFPLRHLCGGKLKRRYDVAPAVQFNAPGFYASDVQRFKSQVGSERYAKFEHERDDIERRAKAGKLTPHEKSLDA